jgi:transketolase
MTQRVDTAEKSGQSSSLIQRLEEIAERLSRTIIEMTTVAGSGHPSSSLSAIDLLAALYCGGIMRYDVRNPHWPARDRFILSKGHAVPALYAVLAEVGFLDVGQLHTLRRLGSPLEGHPNLRKLPAVEASTGSLGQGLSMGLGHALAARLDGQPYRVYVLLGDGELGEGQIWEAALSAAKYQVDNLTAIVDYNQFQQTGSVAQVMPALKPLAEKWRAFGWHVSEIDGHAMPQIVPALRAVQMIERQPQLIIAHTRKGRGLSPFEQNAINRKHGEVLTPREVAVALAELDQQER